jgi:putative drug exporter of the RND superfamily
VYPATSPQASATTTLIQHLRSAVIPKAETGSSLHVYIGGDTATFTDFAQVIGSKMPLFVAVVVALSVLLLALVFRSIVIPLTAAVMNLFSAGAALGALSAAYVWGWGGAPLGASRAGPITPFIPVMIFAVLFGLSMDYQVFLVSRIREEWLRTGSNKEAVRRGLAITGRTITAAAAIMILVFGSFILGSDLIVKQFGLGLAVAVFIDAFIIRMGIVPAAMLLLGRSNWWLPARLGRALPAFATQSLDELTAEPAEPVDV